ncbi:hypothetical protein BJY00DRAFT_84092 [Aspergillus carlsbadensis]|nr:hypothetical protein BJY00DRAFT_84092 [Aspergillus carlsbadensis]
MQTCLAFSALLETVVSPPSAPTSRKLQSIACQSSLENQDTQFQETSTIGLHAALELDPSPDSPVTAHTIHFHPASTHSSSGTAESVASQ